MRSSSVCHPRLHKKLLRWKGNDWVILGLFQIGDLLDPGTRKVGFFVYMVKSGIGFLVHGHHIASSALSLSHILFLTKCLMHPSALCCRSWSVYRWKLFFQSFSWWGRLSLSSVISIWRPIEARIAFFIDISFWLSVGSCFFINHSMSKQ